MLDAEELSEADKAQSTEEEKQEHAHREKAGKRALTPDEIKSQVMFTLVLKTLDTIGNFQRPVSSLYLNICTK